MNDVADAIKAKALAMTLSESTTDNRILDSLPDEIRAAISTYASESGLSAIPVIKGAIKHFLAMDTSLNSELTHAAEDTSLLAALPPVFQSQAI